MQNLWCEKKKVLQNNDLIEKYEAGEKGNSQSCTVHQLCGCI